MNEQYLAKMKEMPEDWWRIFPACFYLSQWSSRYLVSLVIAVRIEGKEQYGCYTGFLYSIKNYLFWLTAGHVIEKIREIITKPEIQVLSLRWFDGCRIQGAESIPASSEPMMVSILKDTGIDFGAIGLSPLESANLLNRIKFHIEFPCDPFQLVFVVIVVIISPYCKTKAPVFMNVRKR